jgi:uncharacterized phage protein (TIGR01671 family)
MNAPKFRAWHKIENRFVDLRSIDFEEERIGYDARGEANYYDSEPLVNIILQQFTGLKDKNNKDIYEGDILRVKGWDSWFDEEGHFYTVIVMFSNGGFVTKAKKVFDDPTSTYRGTPLCNHTDDGECTILGNIFENEELLT